MGAKTGIEWTDSTWSPIRVRVRADAAEIARAKGCTSLTAIAEKMAGHVEAVSGGAMRGTEVTEDQMQSAREFAFARSVGLAGMPDDDQQITVTFGKMVRLMAWYGALRYQAGRDGTG